MDAGKTTDVFPAFLPSFLPSLINFQQALSVTHTKIADLLAEGGELNTLQLLQL